MDSSRHCETSHEKEGMKEKKASRATVFRKVLFLVPYSICVPSVPLSILTVSLPAGPLCHVHHSLLPSFLAFSSSSCNPSTPQVASHTCPIMCLDLLSYPLSLLGLR